MENKTKAILTYFTLFIVSLFFFFWGLVKAKSFLAPIAVAALLAMVVLPIARWLEKRGLKRGWSSLVCTILILLFFVGLGWVVSAQVKSFAREWPQIKETATTKADQLEQFVEQKTGINIKGKPEAGNLASTGSQDPKGAASGQQQEQSLFGSSSSQPSASSLASSASSYVVRFLGFLGTFLLTFIYTFFFLLYRRKFRKSIIKMAPDDKQHETQQIITESTKVSQNYLFGKLILIVILAILYAIGLSLSGVQHAILVSILAAVLTLIPYIGNIIGYALAVGLAFLSGSGVTGALGVTITFAITQFVESYVLEPYIVGDKVNLSPVFTIIVVVLGGAVWGVIGMLIAIPALGIAKVIFDHVPPLQPLGYLFGAEDSGEDNKSNSIFSRMSNWALDKFNTRTQS